MANSLELDWLVRGMNFFIGYRARFSVAAVFVVVAGLPLGVGCDSHPEAQAASVSASATTAAVTPRPSPSAVATVPPEMPDGRHFITTGPLVAEQQADIAPERDGRVMQIAVEIGDHVHKGQLLALLDDRTLRSACDSQKARVASLRAQVNEWEAEQKSGEADLRRADTMRSEKIRSEEDWEHVKYKLDETIAEVARYRAEEASAEADLELAKLQLEQSRIVAPFTGVVGRSSVRVAQEVKKGDILFWITAEAPLHILFTVPESAMAFFPSGARLELTTVDYPELRQSAKILRVSPVVDPASGSVQVIGIVPHASRLLKPGMSMQVRLAP
jgi:membrane fusion protein, multidrug efflux system